LLVRILLQEKVAMPDTRSQEAKHTNYELFMMGVAVLSLLNLVLSLITVNVQQWTVIAIMDIWLSLILMGDFCYRLNRAPNRRYYFFRDLGWLDLIGSLPFGWLRLFRLFRIVRLLRLLRRAGMVSLQQQATERPAGSLLTAVLFLVILVIELGSYAILGVEPQAPGSNIHTASDALWWSVVTIATVGYGDRYPVTNPGRMIGVVVIVSGVGLFSVLTSYLAQGFIRRRQRRTPQVVAEVEQERGSLEARLARLERMLDEHEALNNNLRQEMTELVEMAGKQRGG
jgi:voltage-gated potassium channel